MHPSWYPVLVSAFVAFLVSMLLRPRRAEAPVSPPPHAVDAVPPTLVPAADLPLAQMDTCHLCGRRGFVMPPTFCSAQCLLIGNRMVVEPHLHVWCRSCEARYLVRPVREVRSCPSG